MSCTDTRYSFQSQFEDNTNPMDKKFLFFVCVLLGLFSISAISQAQVTTVNNTPQAPNFDFEAWDNPEPWGWNSSSCFEAGNGPSGFNRIQSIWSSSDVRPGSRGSYSAKISVTQSDWYHYKFPFGTRSYEMMGTLTTGTLYYYDSKGNEKSCIYTNTGDGSKMWPFTGRPDSIIFWAKLPLNNGRVGNMTLYLHDNSQLEDRTPNGTSGGTVIGSAVAQINYNNGQWVRYSVPVTYVSEATPSYMLLSFTAGNNFREVVEGDQLFIDDVMLIYRPTLAVAETMPSELARHGSEPLRFTIPFNLTGTMNPFNNAPDNEVIAYLSDADGNFENRIELGRLTTAESGEIEVELPVDFPDSDNYRIQLESTNYPVVSEPFALKIYRQWYLDVNANNAYGKVEPSGRDTVRHLRMQKLTATANTDCWFLYWEKDGQKYSEDATISFSMDSDKAFVAVFDTTYTLQLPESQVGATTVFENNKGTRLTVLPKDTVKIRTQLNYGYCFYGYQFHDQVYSPDTVAYDMIATQGGDILPLIDSIEYDYTFLVSPDPKLGSTTSNGKHKHFSTVRSVATAANGYSRFLRWEDSTGKVVSLDSVLEFTNISAGGYYIAVFEEEMHKVQTSVNQEGWGHVLQCGSPVQDSVYSAFDLTRIVLEAVPAEGYAFKQWTMTQDGLDAGSAMENPYLLTDTSHLESDYMFKAVFDTLYHQLTVEAVNGKASGQGTYHYKEEAVLVATPSEGYHLDCWVSGKDTLGLKDTLSLVVVCDTVITPVFALNTYQVELVSSDPDLGSINLASGNYAHFSRLELEAIPQALAELRYWVVDGDTVSTESTYVHTVDGPTRIQAVFSRARREVSLTPSNLSYGDVTGQGIYEWGSRVAIQAQAFDGYEFQYWQDVHGNTVLSNPIIIDSIITDTVLTAVFQPMQFDVVLISEGQGKAYIGDAAQGIQQASYPYLQQLVLTAIPESDSYEFAGWYSLAGELLSQRSPESLSVLRDTTLVARFVERRYDLVLSSEPSGAGILTGAGRYGAGAGVDVSARPNHGYEFVEWLRGDVSLGQQPDIHVGVEKDTYLVARFRALEYQVEVSAQPSEAALSLEGSGSFSYGLNSRLRVEPATHFELGAWVDAQGDTLGCQNPLLIDIDGNMEITAMMQPARVQVDYEVLPVLSAGKVEAPVARYQQEVTALAVPEYGYTFKMWTDRDGNEISRINPLVFSSMKDTSFVAVFEKIEFGISMVSNHGKVEGAMSYAYGDTCHLQAVPDEGYRFQSWLDEDGQVIGCLPLLEFQVMRNREIQAVFQPIDIEVNIGVSPVSSGSVMMDGKRQEGSLRMEYGRLLNLTCVPEEGWVFRHWQLISGQDTQDIAETELEYRVDVSGTIVNAVLDRKSYEVSLGVSGDVPFGTLEGEGQYRFGEKVTLKAHPAPHYSFYAFYENDEVVSYDSVWTFIATSDRHIEVGFVPDRCILSLTSAQENLARVVGSGVYAYDSTVRISAVVLDKSIRFSHWSVSPSGEDTLSTLADFDYHLEGDANLFAHFAPASVGLILESSHTGADLRGEGFYDFGQSVEVCATAPEGTHFQAWIQHGQVVSTQACTTVVLERDETFYAQFVADTLELKLDLQDELEDVDLFGEGKYIWGQKVHVRVENLPEGKTFVAWRNNADEVVSSQPDFTFVIKEDVHLSAEWKDQVYHVQVSVEGAGKVSGSGDFSYGEEAVLVAVPEAGYRLEGWYKDGGLISDKDTLRLDVSQDMMLTARFTLGTQGMLAGLNRQDGGSISTVALMDEEGESQLTAHVEDGYRFLYWTVGDSVISTENTCMLPTSLVSQALAHFEPISYPVRITVDNPEGLSEVSGFGTYKRGDEVNFKLSLRDGYQLEGWYLLVDGKEEFISSDNSFKLVLQQAMDIIVKVTQK